MVTISRSARRAQLRAIRNAPLNALLRSNVEVREQAMAQDLRAYLETPRAFIVERLGWTPWKGEGANDPGQVEVLDAYRDALMQQIEMLQLGRGEITEAELRYYRPGMPIRNWIRVDSGHGVGKTKIEAGIHSHFLFTLPRSVVYSYANSLDQLRYQLWKEIRSDLEGKGFPGRILETCEIKVAADHFSAGRATNASSNRGTARFQGQHAPYTLFILDEAEEIPQQIYDSIDAMSTGGVVIVLLVANPQTRVSAFYRAKERPDVINFRMNSLKHPNVVLGQELIPDAIRRDKAEGYIARLCTVVDELDEELFDFQLPWDAVLPNKDDPDSPTFCPAGTIFRPSNEFLWRMLGIAPPDAVDNTLISLGRYEAAKARGRALTGAAARPAVVPAARDSEDAEARIGIDAARWGLDHGTIYVLQGSRMWLEKKIQGQDTGPYVRAARRVILALIAAGVKRISVRVDGGGGYGGGTLDRIRADGELVEAYRKNQVRFTSYEVVFNAVAKAPADYGDCITELYASTADVLRGIAVITPPEELERDLTARRYGWTPYGIREVKELEPKDQFKKREKRSPDDGDGFVLAAAPERLVFREGVRYLGSFQSLT